MNSSSLSSLRVRNLVEEIHYDSVELIGMLKVRHVSGVSDCNRTGAFDFRDEKVGDSVQIRGVAVADHDQGWSLDFRQALA